MEKLLLLIKDKKAVGLGAVVLFFSALWPALLLRDLKVWWQTIVAFFPLSAGYLLLSLLLGFYTLLFVYLRRHSSCAVRGGGFLGGLLGGLFGLCPACFPALSFFLPLSLTLTLSYYSWLFLLASIIFLAFAIRQLWRKVHF